jgi:hypothetical protein
VNLDLVKAAGAVMGARRFHDHAARRYPPAPLFECGHVVLD